jgi:DNA-binding CsgD family transcriptional regulator
MIPGLLNIAIIEPSPILFEGLTNILLRTRSHYQIYQFENPDELLNSPLRERFDLAILNPVYIQGSSKNFQQYRKALPHLRWIALVYAYFDRELLSHFSEVIQITDSASLIMETVEKLRELPDQVSPPSSREQLSERETDVLRCLVNGLSNKEIADKLNISIHTVISHRKNLSQKTGIKSQAGLTIYALSHHIIHLENQ